MKEQLHHHNNNECYSFRQIKSNAAAKEVVNMIDNVDLDSLVLNNDGLEALEELIPSLVSTPSSTFLPDEKTTTILQYTVHYLLYLRNADTEALEEANSKLSQVVSENEKLNARLATLDFDYENQVRLNTKQANTLGTCANLLSVFDGANTKDIQKAIHTTIAMISSSNNKSTTSSSFITETKANIVVAFKCKYCHKAFNTKENLSAHVTRRHCNNNEEDLEDIQEEEIRLNTKIVKELENEIRNSREKMQQTFEENKSLMLQLNEAKTQLLNHKDVASAAFSDMKNENIKLLKEISALKDKLLLLDNNTNSKINATVVSTYTQCDDIRPLVPNSIMARDNSTTPLLLLSSSPSVSNEPSEQQDLLSPASDKSVEKVEEAEEVSNESIVDEFLAESLAEESQQDAPATPPLVLVPNTTTDTINDTLSKEDEDDDQEEALEGPSEPDDDDDDNAPSAAVMMMTMDEIYEEVEAELCEKYCESSSIVLDGEKCESVIKQVLLQALDSSASLLTSDDNILQKCTSEVESRMEATYGIPNDATGLSDEEARRVSECYKEHLKTLEEPVMNCMLQIDSIVSEVAAKRAQEGEIE